ncbi:MAG: methyltransferase domain-containing protein [Phycisphaerales bacterium]|nr:methyltransferase domain-containing protein [Phycisphaerales bacterium]
MRLIHASPGVMVLDKPPGMPVSLRPGERVKTAPRTLTLVAEQVAKLVPVLAGGKPRPVTPLDPEASGLVVFGLDDDTASSLKEYFRSGDAPRTVLAVIEPIGQGSATPADLPEHVNLTVEMRSDARGRVGPAVGEDDARGKAARTSMKVLSRGRTRAVVELTLHTERPGQVHIHLQTIGWRVVAEPTRADGRPRLLLHLARLTLPGEPKGGPGPALALPAPPSFVLAAGAPVPDAPGAVARMARKGQPAAKDDGPRPGGPAAPVQPAQSSAAPAPGAPKSWDHVAEWYGRHLRSGAGDHHDDLIVPGVIRLLGPAPGQQILDIACGEGLLCRELSARGVDTVGVDLSPALVDAAREAHRAARYEVGDARSLDAGALGTFDAAACVMAIMNIDPASEVLKSAASVLKPGGTLVLVLLHPAFRTPGRTSWGWDSGQPARQYRRVDAYLSESRKEIVMNPGAASSGAEPVTTVTYHRPIGAYVNMLGEAGFVVDAMEEWASRRVSEPGPRAKEENRARLEFPLLLAIRARLAANVDA